MRTQVYRIAISISQNMRQLETSWTNLDKDNDGPDARCNQNIKLSFMF